MKMLHALDIFYKGVQTPIEMGSILTTLEHQAQQECTECNRCVHLRSGFGTHLNVQNRKMNAMVTLCTFLLRLVLWRCQNTAHFYWCLHTFVKYVECMQHFHEWVWLDRDLARIWMCRIERWTQWLHSVHSCCAWCSDVVKILHISIGVCTPL